MSVNIRKYKGKLSRLQNGDTIVEVLIAITIVGAIVGAAYVLTNNSTISERQAQERTDALGLAQTQIETLRANANNLPALANSSTPFCMTNQGSSTTYVSNTTIPTNQFGTPNPATLSPTADGGANFAGYPTDCNFAAAGNSQNTTEPVYHLFSTFDSNTNVYTINVRWFSVNGEQVNNLVMYYKVN